MVLLLFRFFVLYVPAFGCSITREGICNHHRVLGAIQSACCSNKSTLFESTGGVFLWKMLQCAQLRFHPCGFRTIQIYTVAHSLGWHVCIDLQARTSLPCPTCACAVLIIQYGHICNRLWYSCRGRFGTPSLRPGAQASPIHTHSSHQVHNPEGTKRVVVTKDLPGDRWLQVLTSSGCRVEVCTSPDTILSNDTIKKLMGTKVDGVIGQLTEVLWGHTQGVVAYVVAH